MAFACFLRERKGGMYSGYSTWNMMSALAGGGMFRTAFVIDYPPITRL
jgi:hypothetical protein